MLHVSLLIKNTYFDTLKNCRFGRSRMPFFCRFWKRKTRPDNTKQHTQGGVFCRSRLVALCRVVLLPGRSLCVVSWCLYVCRVCIKSYCVISSHALLYRVALCESSYIVLCCGRSCWCVVLLCLLFSCRVALH